MQLQHVRLQRLDHGPDVLLIGVDRERDLLRAAAHARAEHPRRVEIQMPRRRRKKHEADHVRARIERDIKGLRGGKAADFNDQRHDHVIFGICSTITSAVLHRFTRFVLRARGLSALAAAI